MGAAGVRRSIILGAVFLLAACTTPAPAPPPPAPQPQVAVAAPPPLPPPPPAPAPDQCGASELQDLVGKPRTDIPIPLEPGRRRVACTTCPLTQDYVAGRQTILYNSQTGLVTSVKCG